MTDSPSPEGSTGTAAQAGPDQVSPEEPTGLPWLRSWRAVYLLVLGGFVLWLGLLYALTVGYR